MLVKISPDTPDVFDAMLSSENGKPITSMHAILCESLYTDVGAKVEKSSADKYLRHMSYRETGIMGEKFKKAMEALKAEALPLTGNALP